MPEVYDNVSPPPGTVWYTYQTRGLFRKAKMIPPLDFQSVLLWQYVADDYRLVEKGEHPEITFDFYLLERLNERLLVAFEPPEGDPRIVREDAARVEAIRKMFHAHTALIVASQDRSYTDRKGARLMGRIRVRPKVSLMQPLEWRQMVKLFLKSGSDIPVHIVSGLRGEARVVDIDTMPGEIFEMYLRRHFQSVGYRVDMTPVSGDYGADLVLDRGEERVVVQVKRYRGRVGPKAVQEVAAARAHYRASRAIVVTNSVYTENARTLAKENDVELWDRRTLIEELSGSATMTP